MVPDAGSRTRVSQNGSVSFFIQPTSSANLREHLVNMLVNSVVQLPLKLHDIAIDVVGD